MFALNLNTWRYSTSAPPIQNCSFSWISTHPKEDTFKKETHNSCELVALSTAAPFIVTTDEIAISPQMMKGTAPNKLN
jgi:hypothetical protein